jgi:hypothetical protein
MQREKEELLVDFDKDNGQIENRIVLEVYIDIRDNLKKVDKSIEEFTQILKFKK